MLLVVVLAQVLGVASASTVVVALPSIGAELGLAGSGLQWTVEAYAVLYASLLLTGGALGDRHGHRRVFLVGAGLFGVGSLVAGSASDPAGLLGGRALQGGGSALVAPCGMALLSSVNVRPASRARAISIWSAASGVAMALGPLVGGLLVAALGWRSVFLVNVPVCVTVVALGRAGPRRSAAAAPVRPFDRVGALLTFSGLAAGIVAITEARSLGWAAPTILLCVLVSVASLVGLARWEAAVEHPLLDAGVLRHRGFRAATIGASAVFFALIGEVVYLSMYFQSVQGWSPLATGAVLLPVGATELPLALIAGRLIARGAAPSAVLLVGLSVTALGLAALSAVGAGTPLATVTAILCLLGVGVGLSLPAATVWALSAAGAGQTGLASGMHNAARQAGLALGVAVLGAVIAARAPAPGVIEREAFVAGLHDASLVAAAAVAVAIVAVVRAPWRGW